MAAVFNILAARRSCGNIHFSYQHYQQGKITLQVSVQMTEYLVATLNELWMIYGFNDCCKGNRYREKPYMCAVGCWFWVEKFSRKFLIKGFYRQSSKSIWISSNLLGSSYFLLANQDSYIKCNLISVQNNKKRIFHYCLVNFQYAFLVLYLFEK